MLLFSDGFENADIVDVYRKWGAFNPSITTSSSDNFFHTNSAIVTGYDPKHPTQPVSRKGGRALYLPSRSQDGSNLFTLKFPKSRTIFFGFALRVLGTTTITMRLASCISPIATSNGMRLGYGCEGGCAFNSGGNSGGSLFSDSTSGYASSLFSTSNSSLCEIYNTSYGASNPGTYRSGTHIATYTSVINSSNISCRWDFPSVDNLPVQVGSVNLNANPFDGEFFYYQVGFTVLGSNPVAGNTSWVESRVGSGTRKRWYQECQTCNPDVASNSYIDAILLQIAPDSSGCWLDDVYLCNDDGDSNNTFLGPVYVRGVDVLSQGSVNDGVCYNTMTENRGDAVGGSMARTSEKIVTATSVSDLAVSFTNFLTTYLRLNKEGSTQTLLFNPVNYLGARPNIYGVVLNLAVMGEYVDLAKSTLRGFIRHNLEAPVYATDLDRHIFSTSVNNDSGSYSVTAGYPAIETRRFCFDNPDGVNSTTFDADILNESEYGFVLTKFTGEDKNWASLPLRANVTLEFLLDESFGLNDSPSRYEEEQVSDVISLSDISQWFYGATINESLVFVDDESEAMGYQHALYELLHLDEDFRLTDQQISSLCCFADDVSYAFHHLVESVVSLQEDNYGFWVELFDETISLTSFSSNDIVVLIDDGFDVSVSDIWDNHLDAESVLDAESSYVWDGHEDGDEYLAFVDFSISAFIDTVESVVDVHLEDFDGNWVEQFLEPFGISDSVLTQHWRYEYLLGVCINSWQITPIEDNGNDGYRAGEWVGL